MQSPQSPPKPRHYLWLLFLFGVAMLPILARWLPLGIPKEFEYLYIQNRYWDGLALLFTVLPAAGIIAIVHAALGRPAPLNRKELSLALLLLCACSFLFHVAGAVLLSPNGFGEAFYHLFQKYGDGAYLLKASEIRNYGDYLAGLEDYLQTKDLAMFPHPSVHPPGFTSFFYIFYWMAEVRAPGVLELRDWLWGYSPQLSEMTSAVPESAHLVTYTAALTLAAFTLWFAAALLPAVTFFLARLWLNVKASLLAAAMAALFPGTHFFNPSTDQLLPLAATLVMFLGAASLIRRSTKLAFVYGACLCLAMNFSLAIGVCGLIFVLHGLLLLQKKWATEDSPVLSVRSFVYLTLRAGTGVAVVCGLLLAMGDMNLLNVIRLCLENNATFNSFQARSYLPWLFVSPVETAYSFGWPFSFVLVLSIWWALKGKTSALSHRAAPGWAVLLAVLCVALSGVNRGEVERLWLFLYPALGLSPLLFLESLSRREELEEIPSIVPSASSATFWTAVLGLQVLQTILLRLSVDFTFSATQMAT